MAGSRPFRRFPLAPFFRSLLLAAAASCLCASFAAKKPKPGVEITGIQSTRQEGEIGFEGTIRVHGKPLKGLILHFEFLDSRGALLSIQKMRIEERLIEPGEELSFTLGGNDVPRAVKYEIKVTDGQRMEVRTVNGGPHPLG